MELASLANRRKRLILREFPTDDVDKPGDKCPAVLTLGVSLDIENYCTLRLLFNQSLVLDKVPEYGKPAKYCSP